jgi:hypothetical protein
MLKCFLKMQGVRTWTGLIWLRIEITGFFVNVFKGALSCCGYTYSIE